MNPGDDMYTWRAAGDRRAANVVASSADGPNSFTAGLLDAAVLNTRAAAASEAAP